MSHGLGEPLGQLGLADAGGAGESRDNPCLLRQRSREWSRRVSAVG